ncbi:cyclophane-forming radical SAM peptide maturase AmcB [Streptomyces bluensis]|uniref:cyclophane-forming radical SAM peptide maturase AmcB n=1 Tax=Streptomyces bluensis TaxID=33897 RepID=UPI001E649FDC|nr:cyclophane-forming radical SAM peptide maturase AmcB [Streptomyces bluensis]
MSAAQAGSADGKSLRTGAAQLAEVPSVMLMQPTTLCNLNCTYCYLPDRNVARRMSTEVAQRVAAGVREWSRQRPVAVVWHGGEPLAVGPAYFRALVEPFGPGETHPVIQAVQTNATLIDEAWCEVFATVPVRVTVSLDGPQEANAARVDWAGGPSTQRAMSGIAMLRQAGIRFGMIAVVADASPGAAADLYRFACELGCDNLGVNLAEKKGVYAGGQDPEYSVVAFWQELAACWHADPRIQVRELDHAYTYIREELSGTAAQRADRPVMPLPLVMWDGDFLPVGAELAGFRSAQHGPFTAGNVLDTPLTVLTARATEVPWVAEALAGVTNCRKHCDYFAYCRGGQVANKYFETGRLDSTETTYCRASKISLMEGILRHAERSRP